MIFRYCYHKKMNVTLFPTLIFLTLSSLNAINMQYNFDQKNWQGPIDVSQGYLKARGNRAGDLNTDVFRRALTSTRAQIFSGILRK